MCNIVTIKPDGPDKLATFHPFPRLPAEIRNEIWKLAATPRIMNLHFVNGTEEKKYGHFKRRLRNKRKNCSCVMWYPPIDFPDAARGTFDEIPRQSCSTAVPPLLHVNREARSLILPLYKEYETEKLGLGYGWSLFRPKRFYFDRENDLFGANGLKQFPGEVVCNYEDSFGVSAVLQPRNLLMRGRDFHESLQKTASDVRRREDWYWYNVGKKPAYYAVVAASPKKLVVVGWKDGKSNDADFCRHSRVDECFALRVIRPEEESDRNKLLRKRFDFIYRKLESCKTIKGEWSDWEKPELVFAEFVKMGEQEDGGDGMSFAEVSRGREMFYI